MARRRQPVVGTRVAVAFLATRRPGTIEAVAEEGRTLTVVTDDGEEIRFELSRATGVFVAGGARAGARLLFEDG